MINKRKLRVWYRQNKWDIIIALLAIANAFLIGYIIGTLYIITNTRAEIPAKTVMLVQITPSVVATSPYNAPKKAVAGVASYYTVDCCVGCRSDRIMANGEPLNDNAVTVAYNRAPLNSYVTITNPKTGKTVRAKVTDRGGFERLGRVIDLSLATKNALGCGDLCKVQIMK